MNWSTGYSNRVPLLVYLFTRRIVTLFFALYKYSYLLTYLLTYLYTSWCPAENMTVNDSPMLAV